MLLCAIVLIFACVLYWCFMKAAIEDETEDYYEAIYRETMHELSDYDEN
ncbi:MAG: hypothetical protein IJD96_11655 [Lachnospiraceae bacterium]|nr:hypothetical protein [Lachnospiraceae bacterium]